MLLFHHFISTRSDQLSKSRVHFLIMSNKEHQNVYPIITTFTGSASRNSAPSKLTNTSLKDPLDFELEDFKQIESIFFC